MRAAPAASVLSLYRTYVAAGVDSLIASSLVLLPMIVASEDIYSATTLPPKLIPERIQFSRDSFFFNYYYVKKRLLIRRILLCCCIVFSRTGIASSHLLRHLRASGRFLMDQ